MEEYTYGRRSFVYVGIENKDVTGDIRRFIKSLEYEENADGASDELRLTLYDTEYKWLDLWSTGNGTRFDAKIEVKDWEYPGELRYVDCGIFYQDSFSASGFPIQCTIRAVSLPNVSNQHSKTWENVKMSEIVQEISENTGCTADMYFSDFLIAEMSQNDEKDIQFLYRLCSEYGLGMKAYSDKLIVFEHEERESAEAVGELNIRQVEDFSIEENLIGTYTGVTLTYTDAKSDKTYTYRSGTDERLLTVEEKVSSQGEAERKAKAALYQANSKAVTLSFRIEGGKELYAGVSYNISGLGRYSGKYFFDSVTHSVSEGYFIAVAAHKVDQGG